MDKNESITKRNIMTTEDDINFVNEVLGEENCIFIRPEFLSFFDGYSNTRFLKAFMLEEFIKLFLKNKGQAFKYTNNQIAQKLLYPKNKIGRFLRARADLIKKGFISVDKKSYITVNAEHILKELSKLNKKQLTEEEKQDLTPLKP